MACRAIHTWTFSDLVGAFLDLSITCLLLFASCLTFFVAKILGFFGLSLPCPCDGLFGNPKNNQCLLRQLVDGPPQRISFVHHSVKNKFPFDAIWNQGQNEHSNSKMVNEETQEDGQTELKDRTCSSFSQEIINLTVRDNDVGNEQIIQFGKVNSISLKEGKLDLKGKGALSLRSRGGLRHHRKWDYVDYGKFSSISSYDALQIDDRDTPQSPSSINKIRVEASKDIITGGVDVIHYGESKITLSGTNLEGKTSYDLQYSNHFDGKNQHEIDALRVKEFGCNVCGDLGSNNSEKIIIRELEQALEDEHVAHAALYLELEKERSAATSATKETMAMILRLQEEKASIEMEARQYQRMIEEKFSFDVEEMEILKEILLRREREKHFLEKEVEAYREIFFGNENSIMRDMALVEAEEVSSLYLTKDPTKMLQRIILSIDKSNMKIANCSLDNEIQSIESEKCTIAQEEELQPRLSNVDPTFLKEMDMHGPPSINMNFDPLISNVIHDELFAKGMTSSNENPFSKPKEVERQGSYSKWDPSTLSHQYSMNGIDQTASNNLKVTPIAYHVSNDNRIIIAHDIDNVKVHDSDQDQESKGPPNSVSPFEPLVYDVEVIDDKFVNCNEMNIEKDEYNKQISSIVPILLEIPVKCDSPILNRPKSMHDVSPSYSKLYCKLPPTGPSRRKSSHTGLQRHSVSPIDHEKLKIDNEVQWLRERLRVVQEEREKLNISTRHRDKEEIQLKLLEDIVGQLREIQQLTKPRKVERQASLPPLFSKVTSKKRCLRSSSLEVQKIS